MTRQISRAAVVTLLVLGAASCGGDQRQTQEAAPAAATSPTQPLEIAFRTEPDPPRSGDVTLEADVKAANGQDVSDAEVSAEFYMPAMPEVKMPEMRNTIRLQHVAGGLYRGKGSIMMAGKWDVTVTVKRGGQEAGTRTIAITAQ